MVIYDFEANPPINSIQQSGFKNLRWTTCLHRVDRHTVVQHQVAMRILLLSPVSKPYTNNTPLGKHTKRYGNPMVSPGKFKWWIFDI